MKRVSPQEASLLMASGYTYVDVRSEREFLVSHPAGAHNVPLDTAGPRGLSRNADFVPLMQRLFEPHAKIVVGCASGVRSREACAMLAVAGFTDVVDQRAGMGGARSAFGAIVERGWEAAGLAVAQGNDEGSWAALRARIEK